MSWQFHPWPADETAATFVASPIRVELARSRRPRAKSSLPGFVLVTPAPISAGIAGYLTPPRSRAPKVRSNLRRVLPTAATFVARPTEVTLARSRRPRPKSSLPPSFSLKDPTAPFAPLEVKLAPSHRRARKVVYELALPVVVVPEAVVVARPIVVKLVRIRPRPTDASVFKPAVVAEADPSPLGGTGISLAPQRRGKPKSKLGRPVVAAAVVTQTFTGPSTHLVRIRPRRTLAIVRRPALVTPPVDAVSEVTLAYSRRGKPKSRLSLTRIIDLRPQVFFVSTTLVRIKPPPVHSILRRPTDLVDAQDLGLLRTHLAYSRRGAPKSILRDPVVIDLRPQTYFVSTTLVRIRPVATRSRLRPPTDLIDKQDLGFVAVTLSPQRRGTPKSRLSVPAVVTPVAIDARLAVTLSRIRPPRTHPFLRAPVVVNGYVADAVAEVSLAPGPQKRGKAKSTLRPPTAVFPPIAYWGPGVRLTNPLDRVPPTMSRLRPPTITVAIQTFTGPQVALASSRRGTPKSILRRPVVVAPVLARAILVALAPSSRGIPKSKLSDPAVVQAFRIPVVAVALAPSSRGIPKSRLGQPTDLVDAQDLGQLAVTLAYSRRGAPKSELRQPVVVAPVLARAIRVELARIRPVAVRSILRKPVVIDLSPQVRYLAVSLAYSRRGKAKSELPQASLFSPRAKAETVLAVSLAYSRRGRPKSILRAPRAIDLRPQTQFLSITLTRIRPRRTTVLYTGVVYGGRVHAPVALTLAPSTRLARAPLSRLSGPVVTRTFVAKPTETTLARIRPPRTHPFLRSPVVVGASVALARPTGVTLAPQSRRPGEAVLSPPAVIRAPDRFFGPTVSLAPSSRGSTIVVRIEPDAAASPPCYGVATGSTAPSAENALETEAGATTTSTITAGAETASSTAAASTIEGTTAPGAENDISDAQREGC